MSDSQDAHWLRCTAGKIVEGPHTTPVADGMRKAADEIDRLRAALTKQNDEICQTLGKALGYPWFKDDQVVFPGATEENGVCVGDHVAESIAEEAARTIRETRAALAETVELLETALRQMNKVINNEDWSVWEMISSFNHLTAALAKAKQEGGEL